MKKNIKQLGLVLSICALSLGGSLSVYAAITTEVQPESSINSTATPKHIDGMRGTHNMDLSTFVEDGTITQAEADSINAFMTEKSEERKTEMESLKDLSEEERKAYFESKKGTEKTGFLTEVVEKGIITQAQADIITANGNAFHINGEARGPKGHMNFEQFVTDGVISQETADNISTYMEAKLAERTAEKEAGTNVVIEERHTFTEGTTERVDMFDELVAENIITTEEADAIRAAMPQKGNHNSNHEAVTVNKL